MKNTKLSKATEPNNFVFSWQFLRSIRVTKCPLLRSASKALNDNNWRIQDQRHFGRTGQNQTSRLGAKCRIGANAKASLSLARCILLTGPLLVIGSAAISEKMMLRFGHLRTEKDKMQSGDPYDPSDAELWADRCTAQHFMADYNKTNDDDIAIRDKLLKDHFGIIGAQTTLRAPLYVDYGYNIFIANNVFLNYGCVLLDVCKITIGPYTQIGPGVQIYTADHPHDPDARRSGIEFGKPITIGTNVWIGGHAIILPGITIGDNAIIGAGSVVTRDVAAGVKIAGNPARALV